jgi:transposase-like protein
MKKRKKRTSATMYPLVAQWQNSTQSKAAFCATHQINIHTFTYWVQKYRQTQAAPPAPFVALEVAPEQTPSAATYLRYPNGVELHFSDLPQTNTLTPLLKIQV